ncbi:hypothetical protein HMPREF1544_11170 [Mucor circinelloides 1006PhL]|uniref:Uncharacterized protein n=1 Tax=Mucor circinelloides f. circinelloides (strain 1006PhL) TaxID=1220926 RepID=S2JHU3_MUCC1|nr:hypothetical protein HMPREF1544_11170 [Mucor circinelloides 1006PhL]
MPNTSDLLAPELSSFITGRYHTREDRLRALRQTATHSFLPGLAAFIGEKLMASTDGTRDTYCMALSYYQQQQYERTLEILNKKQVLSRSVQCRYLAALCSLTLGNGIDALYYLGPSRNHLSLEERDQSCQTDSAMNSSNKDATQDDTHQGHLKLESAMCVARGKAYLLGKDVYNAKDCFKEALTVDVKCYDALEMLVKCNMMEERAEWEFIMTLPYEEHCGADSSYYRDFYRLKTKKAILEGERTDADPSSVDVQLSIAQCYFSQSRYADCLEVCKQIKAQDAGFTESIPLYAACLYELRMKSKLYEYAQELVSELRDEAVSWHAVGLYHLCIKKHSEARRYFSHALTLNCFFEPSWLGYAYTFSLEKDHSRAIDAYMDCSKLILGSHLPYMHIAMEYIKVSNTDLAFDFFEKSLQKCNHDPFLFNEIAVYYYKQGLYKDAREHLHTALSLAKERQCKRSLIWEKVWCSLGHVYRHPPFQDYDRALQCFENALEQNPKNADAQTAVGMVYQLKGNTARAIVEYREALNYTDTPELVNELLQSAIMDNFKKGYASNSNSPRLDDSFDIFKMANSIGVEQDRVAVELEQDGRWTLDNTEGNQSVLFTEDGMLVDQGDLLPAMPREARL